MQKSDGVVFFNVSTQMGDGLKEKKTPKGARQEYNLDETPVQRSVHALTHPPIRTRLLDDASTVQRHASSLFCREL